MHQLKSFTTALMVLFALVLAGCNSGPSGNDLKKLMTKETPDFMEIKKVEVLNSVKRDNGFLVKYETTVAFTKSYADLVKDMEAAAENDPMNALMGAMMLQMLGMQFGEWQAGASFSDTDEGLFAKGSRGWMLVE